MPDTAPSPLGSSIDFSCFDRIDQMNERIDQMAGKIDDLEDVLLDLDVRANKLGRELHLDFEPEANITPVEKIVVETEVSPKKKSEEDAAKVDP